MGNRIIGIDLGATTLRLAHLEVGFRRVTLRRVETHATAPEAATLSSIERVTARMAQLAPLLPSLHDDQEFTELAVALPGELVTFRLIDLPFSDPRRIESVLSYELETEVLQPIDELVIDHVLVRQASEGGATRVLVAAAPKAAIAQVVAKAAELGLPLRSIGAAPLAHLAGLGEEIEQPRLLVDIGASEAVVVAVHRARPELARSIPFAGRWFSEAIATAFHLDGDTAERTKLEAGFIAHAGMRPESPPQRRMDACLREAVRPLVRELRQTLAAYSASYGGTLSGLWLTGRGAQLPGLAEHLQAELELPVSAPPSLPLPVDEAFAPDAAVAVGLAFQTAEQGLQVDFRKGEFAYRSDYSFLRGKAVALAGALAAVLLFAGLNAFASLRGLHQEEERLQTRLDRAAAELFGADRAKKMDARAISEELRGKGGHAEVVPIPSVTAFDLLDEVSRQAPPSEKIRLDISELKIEPKKIYLKATTQTNQQMDDFADELKKIDCFKELQKGKSRTVSGPSQPSSDTRSGETKTVPTELKEFDFNITTTCP